jgi:dihydrodipicolinate synthase/N-acetylneuraminate lyase
MKPPIDMKKEKKYQGIVVPAVTPLQAGLTLDTTAVEKLFSLFREHEVMPFILGTTGEAASLSLRIRQDYVRLAARLKQSGELLYAGISSNCMEDSVELAKFCFGEGVDVVVATLPSYYALTEDQMKRYLERLADRIGGPLMIYNIPATTHHSIPIGLIDELSHHPAIVGVKDSERDEERMMTSIQTWSRREDFSYFLGWAARSADALLNGCDGLVPSTANINPGLYKEMEAAARQGNKETLFRLQKLSDQLGSAYQSGRTLGESLGALKLIMHKEGLCQDYMMPPL